MSVAREGWADFLTELPDGSGILDRFGDIAQKLNGLWHYPETAPMASEKVSKYFPFEILHIPGQKH